MRARPEWLLASLLALSVAVAACSGGSGDDDDDDDDDDGGGPVYYWEDVAPIVNENCVGCHYEGGIGGFAFGTYGTAFTIASSMQVVTASREMPPSTIDNSGSCNTWSDARWLSDAEIDTIADWVAGGRLEGNPANAPPAPTPLPSLSEVDATLDIGVDYAPPDNGDEYRCFLVDPGNAGTTHLVGYETHPGNPAIVHHVVLFMPRDEGEEAAAQALDDADGEPGYQCFGASGVDANILTAWAPGTGATFFPAGTGLEIEGGRRLILQVHYNTATAVGTDRTTIDLDLEASGVTPAYLLPVFADNGFPLPPGETEYEVTESMVLDFLPVNATIHMIYPHMHTRGRRLTLELTRDSEVSCMANVDRWDFGWQQFFTASPAIQIQPNDEIRIRCYYNTELEDAPVPAGENTDEEMCGVGVYATVP